MTEDKIEMAYRLLADVMELVATHNGGNQFKMPHNGLGAELRADGWDISY